MRAGWPDGLDLLLSHADDHADAAVEHAVHLVFVDVALSCNQSNTAGRVQLATSITAWAPSGSTRDVVEQAAAGDVGHGLDRPGILDQLEQRLDVDAGRCHQQLGERLAGQLCSISAPATSMILRISE